MTFQGSKFDKTLTTAEVCARIRADLKAAIKTGALPSIKVSAKTKTFSGGSSITITLVDAPFNVINPKHDPDRYQPNVSRYSDEAITVLDAIQSVAKTYRRDNSDAQTDYFDCNFYLHVDIAWQLQKAHRLALAEVSA